MIFPMGSENDVLQSIEGHGRSTRSKSRQETYGKEVGMTSAHQKGQMLMPIDHLQLLNDSEEVTIDSHPLLG
jgi:hypothetical protein